MADLHDTASDPEDRGVSTPADGAGASPSPAESRSEDGPPPWVLLGLMAVIFVLLTVMWLRERSGRISWQKRAAALESRLAEMQSAIPMMQGLAGMGLPRQAGGQDVRPIQREDLVPRTMTLDGRPRNVLVISPSAGRRVGFQPGDVVVVSEPVDGAGPPPATPTTDATPDGP